MNAQITMFVLIGILLILGIGVFVWQMSKIQQASFQKKHSPDVIARPVREYVTSCLEIAAGNALKLLGEQGGVIYQSQGGITPDPAPTDFGKDYAAADDKKVAYLIYPPSEDVGALFSASPPLYPWEHFPLIKPDSAVSTKGYFGINTLAPLYNTSPNSIQTQLETFTAKNTEVCADWKQFERQGLDIKSEAPKVEMLISDTLGKLETEEAIRFTLHWPIQIKSVQGTTARIESFSTNVELPFGKIYYAIKELIDKEVQDINFTINSTPAYTLFVKNNVINNDDLVSLQFNINQQNQQKFNFQFARHNRMPAISYIPKEKLEAYVWHAGVKFSVSGNELLISDPCPDTNSPTSLHLESLDPDEDNIQYILYPVSAVFREPSGTKPPFELRIIASDGEQVDYQNFRIKTTCCPEGCPA